MIHESARREARKLCRYAPHCSIHLGERRPKRLTPEERELIVELRAAGLSMGAIARMLEVRPDTVHYNLKVRVA